MKDMKRNKGDRKNSKNVLDNFVLIDEPIDLSTQKEYVSLSETIDFGNVDCKEVLTGSDKLFYEDTPIESKKKILILLGHLGTPESCRIVEKYLKSSESNLRDWALLSLKECRMFLESVLLKEEGGLYRQDWEGRTTSSDITLLSVQRMVCRFQRLIRAS